MKELGLVIPCYDEASRLPADEFLNWAHRHPEWTLCFVNDGSRDDTGEKLRGLSERASNIRVVQLEKNQGKAEAVRQGLLSIYLEHTWCGYLDADLATPLSEIERIYSTYRESEFEMILGSRVRRLGTSIERNPWRHYIGRVGASLISLVLKLPTYDTQCGAKLIRSHLIVHLMSERFLSRWLFDVEILARLRNHLGLEKIQRLAHEDALRYWYERAGSKLKLSDSLLVFRDLWKIHRRYNSVKR